MHYRLAPCGLALLTALGISASGVAPAAPSSRPDPVRISEHLAAAISSPHEVSDSTWLARGRARAERIRRARDVRTWNQAVVLIAVARQQREQRARARLTVGVSGNPVAEIGSRCGGDLPPCWIMRRESGGNIRAKNPSSSASGKWQILDSTWGGFGGYAHAGDAPEAVQDAKARTMAPCNWQPPNYCA